MAIAFSEAEMLMLSSLAYSETDVTNIKSFYDSNGNPIGEPLSVDVLLSNDNLKNLATSGGMADQLSNHPEDMKHYMDAIESLKKKLEEHHFVISKTVNHNGTLESGFSAFAIEPQPNPDRQVLVCCRGSDDMRRIVAKDHGTFNDWVGADLALLWDTQTRQQEEMEEFMADLTGYDHISLSGHSLGGNLAMYGGVTYLYPEHIDGVYSFDGPGFNSAFLVEYQNDIDRILHKIHNFQNENDVVSSLLHSIGRVEIIERSMDDGNWLNNHNRWALKVDSSGHLVRNPDGAKADGLQEVHAASLTVNCVPMVPRLLLDAIVYYTTPFAVKAVKAIQDLYRSVSKGHRYAAENPYFQANTAMLRGYAERLRRVNRRLKDVDRRLDDLYLQVGWRNLDELLKADLMTSYNLRVMRCANALENTAEDLEQTERKVCALF